MSFVHVLPRDVRGVVYRLGRPVGVKGPGLVFILPFVDRLVRVDLSPERFDFDHDVISQDNIALRVSGEATYRVADASKALERVADYRAAVPALLKTTLVQALGGEPAAAIELEPKRVAAVLADAMHQRAAEWGIEVGAISLRARASAGLSARAG